MTLFRKMLRRLGLPVHAGWRSIHKSGCRKQCTGCGEVQGAYHLVGMPRASWWETEVDGDGSCGVKPLPIRGL